MWCQERIEDGDLELDKIRGDDNPADLFTTETLGGKFKEGRAENSLE